MKNTSSEYYVFRQQGYVKSEKSNAPQIKDPHYLQISSKCNQLLPYRVHRVKTLNIQHSPQPLQKISEKSESFNEKAFSEQQRQGEKEYKVKKQQRIFHYSMEQLSAFRKKLDKDQVISVHLQDNLTSRTNNEKSMKESKSMANFDKNQLQLMKKSGHSVQQTNYSMNSSRENIYMWQVIKQLQASKRERQILEQKYQKLAKMVQNMNSQEKSRSYSQYKNQDKTEDDHQKNYMKYSSPPTLNAINDNNITQTYTRNVASPKSLSYENKNQYQLCLQTKYPQQNEQTVVIPLAHWQQVSEQIIQLENMIVRLQNKIQERQRKHRQQIVERQLMQKQKEIEEIKRQNLYFERQRQKNRQMNRVSQKAGQNRQSLIYVEKSTFCMSFVMSLVMMLIFIVGFKTAQC